MKKRIVLGDIHGRFDTMKLICDGEKPDQVILLGDYCDSYKLDTPDIVKSWKDIIKFRKAFVKKHGGDSFVMLLGNHDWHYITTGQRYSGFKTSTFYALHDSLKKALFDTHILQIIYLDELNRTIYSHAGITNTWMKEWDYDHLNMINEQFNEASLDFSHMTFDMSGNSKWQGPLWVRPGACLYDFYHGEGGNWTQIVGHTRMKSQSPLLMNSSNPKEKAKSIEEANYICIDSLPFFFLRETLDDNGILIKREIVENEKIDYDYIQ